MTYVLGVDGGGSKTLAVIVDEYGRMLGVGRAGCGNYQINGIEEMIQNLKAALDEALAEAGLTVSDVDSVVYGLAGADRPKDFAILRPALATLPFKKWEVVCDTMEGLRIGSLDNTGVVLVCGSGTNAAGRNHHGQTSQVGGFGYLFGDAAGGSYLAQQAFRAAVRSWEGREQETVLTTTIPAYFGFRTMEELFDHCLDHDVADVPGQLCVVLHDAADAGDDVAIQILESTGYELGLAANATARRLGNQHDELTVVLVGSVIQKGKNQHLIGAIEQTVRQDHAKVAVVIPDLHPVYGSIMLAMDDLGIVVSESILQNFRDDGRNF